MSETLDNFLMHYGIKGQKWGVRRYQHEDGTLTEEGRKRYNQGMIDTKVHKNPEDGKYYYYTKDDKGNTIERQYRTNINELTKEELAQLNQQISLENTLNKHVADVQRRADESKKDVLDVSANVLNATAKALPTGNGKYVKKDYSSMSDQELRDRIARLQLEESYGRLSGDTKYVKSGSERAREILQTAGSVVAIGASSVALAIKINDAIDAHKAKKQLGFSQSAIDEMQEVLMHHGIKGQKWGIRRYQNEDGSLTKEGMKRYGGKTSYNELSEEERNDLAMQAYKSEEEHRKAKAKFKAVVIGGAVVTAAVMAGAAWINHKYNSQDNAKPKSTRKRASKGAAIKAVTGVVVDKPFVSSSSSTGKAAKTVFDATFREIKPKASSPAVTTFIASKAPLLLGMRHSAIDEMQEVLMHHGIKGQKWGVRRYQNGNGSLTPEGKERYRTNLGTKEMLKNTSSYGRLTFKDQLAYQHYGKKSGAKKGLLIGLASGVTAGAAKSVIDVIRYPEKRKGRTGEIANRFVSNMLVGGFGGAFIGSLIGKHVGKASAQADVADRGKQYTDAILATPVNRIMHSDLMDTELYHFGILGQKWGIRRYQNKDGSLTEEGRIRYGKFDTLSKATAELEKSYEPIKSTYEKWVSNEGPGNTLIYDYTEPSGRFYNKKYTLNDGSPNMELINKDYSDYIYKEYHKIFENKNFKDDISKFRKVKQNYENVEKDAWGELKKFKNNGYKDPIIKAYLDDNSKRVYDIYEASRIFDPKNLELSPSDLTKVVTYGLFD